MLKAILRTTRLFIALITMAASSQALEAEEWTVQRMLYACEIASGLPAREFKNAEEAYDAAFCVAFVRGVGGMLAYNCLSINEGYTPLFRAEAPSSLGAAVQAFVNWARENPSLWGEQAQDGLLLSLMAAFPCQS